MKDNKPEQAHAAQAHRREQGRLYCPEHYDREWFRLHITATGSDFGLTATGQLKRRPDDDRHDTEAPHRRRQPIILEPENEKGSRAKRRALSILLLRNFLSF